MGNRYRRFTASEALGGVLRITFQMSTASLETAAVKRLIELPREERTSNLGCLRSALDPSDLSIAGHRPPILI
jgi:hypothetical protein